MPIIEKNRNRSHSFHEDFMFQLTSIEKGELVANCDRFKTLKHSIVTPYAFTEQGVAMLSSVLNSERAIMVNVSIMRVFSKLKQLTLSHSELLRKVEALERKYGARDRNIGVIFAILKKMLILPKPKKTGKMGF